MLAVMENLQISRLSPLKLKYGKTLRNRIVVPPMASQTADVDGFVTDQTLAHYRRLAEVSAGLLMVEYTYVHSSGKSEDHQLGIQRDDHITGLASLASLIKQSGAVAGIQLTHSGGKTERSMTGGIQMGPSAVAVPVKDRNLEQPTPMTLTEIELWKFAFAKAADRAAQAGFDLIELHAAHGYGLNQWLSPITNQRDDEYGHSLQGRRRLLLEIVHLVKSNYPQLLISVRMPGQDFLEGGLTINDTIDIAQALENVGVDILNISSGIGGWRRPSPRIGEGYLVNEAQMIQAAVSIPVIGVGVIESGKYIDESLRLKRFALAAVGRAILKDPEHWRHQNLENNKTK